MQRFSNDNILRLEYRTEMSKIENGKNNHLLYAILKNGEEVRLIRSTDPNCIDIKSFIPISNKLYDKFNILSNNLPLNGRILTQQLISYSSRILDIKGEVIDVNVGFQSQNSSSSTDPFVNVVTYIDILDSRHVPIRVYLEKSVDEVVVERDSYILSREDMSKILIELNRKYGNKVSFKKIMEIYNGFKLESSKALPYMGEYEEYIKDLSVNKDGLFKIFNGIKSKMKSL